MDFFYDSQLRRYLLQFMRIFSDIKVRNGPDAAGNYTLTRVPIIYGDPSAIVAQIIKGVSENTMMPVPMFSVWIESIKMAPTRRQDTQFVGKVSSIERQFNKETQTYGTEAGIRYDVERYMPVPYDVIFKLDCWTSNTLNKMQIMEQINCFFNPSIQLQQNSNLFDWTSIFEVWMEEYIWSNRTIPQGNEVERDVSSWRFKVPIFINPPAKVKRSSLIAEIVTNVFETTSTPGLEESIDGNYDYFRTAFNGIPDQLITIIGENNILVSRNNNQDEITLLHPYGAVTPILNWQALFNKYGQITANITKIRLKLDPNIDVNDTDVIGDISIDPIRQNVLIFKPDIDTLPATNILPIISIIDPTEVTPGNGLPMPVTGQRYLLTSENTSTSAIIPPGVTSSPWGANIVAYQNDIIEFNGVKWGVVFDSKNSTGLHYVINNQDGCQYTYDGTQWTYTYYGKFSPGYWRIDNIMPIQNGTINDYP